MTASRLRLAAAATLVGLVCSATGRVASGQDHASREYDVKAGFLFNFARLVDFPEHAFESPSDDLRVQLVGHDTFDGALDRLVAGKMINRHRLVIEYSDTLSSASPPHVVFVSRSEQKRLTGILSALKGAPTLTVSDIHQFADRGGVIGLVTHAGSVRFAINRAAARQARLRVDSRLLSLAMLVGPDAAGTDDGPLVEGTATGWGFSEPGAGR